LTQNQAGNLLEVNQATLCFLIPFRIDAGHHFVFVVDEDIMVKNDAGIIEDL